MQLLFFILFILAISCSPAQKHKSFIPEEYHYPLNNIGKGKIKVFQNLETAQQVFSNVEFKEVSGKSYLFATQYVLGRKIDSSVSVNDELVENYGFDNGRVIKRDVKEDVIIDIGKKYDHHKVIITYNTAISTFSSTREEEYLKDTLFQWQGTPVSCLVIKAVVSDVNESKDNSLLRQEHKTNFIFYHAKGVGLVRFTRNEGNNVSTWDLKEIKDLMN